MCIIKFIRIHTIYKIFITLESEIFCRKFIGGYMSTQSSLIFCIIYIGRSETVF